MCIRDRLIGVLSINSVCVRVCVCVKGPLEPNYSASVQGIRFTILTLALVELHSLHKVFTVQPYNCWEVHGYGNVNCEYENIYTTCRCSILTAVLCKQVLWVDLNMLSGGGGGFVRTPWTPPAYGPDVNWVAYISKWIDQETTFKHTHTHKQTNQTNNKSRDQSSGCTSCLLPVSSCCSPW